MADQDEHYQAIGQALVDELPEGWASVEVNCYMVSVFTEFHCRYTTTEGDSVSFEVPDDLFEHFMELREELYEPGRGAWFAATFTMETSGAFGVDYDYDSRPPFQPPPEDATWLEDLRAFPRDPELIPDWMPRSPQG